MHVRDPAGLVVRFLRGRPELAGIGVYAGAAPVARHKTMAVSRLESVPGPHGTHRTVRDTHDGPAPEFCGRPTTGTTPATDDDRPGTVIVSASGDQAAASVTAEVFGPDRGVAHVMVHVVRSLLAQLSGARYAGPEGELEVTGVMEEFGPARVPDPAHPRTTCFVLRVRIALRELDSA